MDSGHQRGGQKWLREEFLEAGLKRAARVASSECAEVATAVRSETEHVHDRLGQLLAAEVGQF